MAGKDPYVSQPQTRHINDGGEERGEAQEAWSKLWHSCRTTSRVEDYNNGFVRYRVLSQATWLFATIYRPVSILIRDSRPPSRVDHLDAKVFSKLHILISPRITISGSVSGLSSAYRSSTEVSTGKSRCMATLPPPFPAGCYNQNEG